ncbi:MAG: pyruvate dehydrogenase (acetyl-transferring), homodimeric type [Sphaerochaeta sp.]|jgi:pyruvate dehydrogenase E1 component|nr:pyruvate dehydrogenase (acetyl-transferring), homodimeric type [Sphaerochaeta sp.]MDX9915646.1 pyruvate dehydrogenase (acetyl-transferring), homodimeric type [Sphaerochaeta sp.]
MSDSYYTDTDPLETQEWLDSLEGVVKAEGEAKADFLLRELTQRARHLGVNTSPGVISPYANTLDAKTSAKLPSEDSLVARNVAAFVRWNAMAMVAKANLKNHGIGGHIASYASYSSIYEVGFNWFFKEDDLVYFQGHSSPGVYARAFVEGRLTEEELNHFREEVDGGGLSSYPHPHLMPHFWQFPTVSMGLGPLMGIYQARFMKYIAARNLKEADSRRVWVFMGDGESDEPESLAALSLAARESLDNLIFVVNANLQRLDGPVRGNGKIIQELEGKFRGAGWNVIKVIWGSEWDSILERDTKGILLQKLSTMVDGEFQAIQVKGPAYLREKIFGDDEYLKSLIEDKSDKDLWQMTRGGHDPRKIYSAFQAAIEHKGEPTVILFKTIKGYGMGSGEASMGAHNVKSMDRSALLAFRDLYHVPLTDDQVEALPFIKPDPDSPEAAFLRRRRDIMGKSLPFRTETDETLQIPALDDFSEMLASTEAREISTTMAFVRMLTKLVKDKQIGNRIVPIVPDEARTFGMEGLFRQIGIYAPHGQLYEPADSEDLMWYREIATGQILEEGITEAGATASWIAAATSYANHHLTMVPFYTFYSMFGFQRVGDLLWAAGDSRAKGFLMGATAGRTTLLGEGLQHEDGHGLLLASTIPTIQAYDPTFSYELAVVIQDGMRRMYQEKEEVFYYITLMNENYSHPAMPAGVEEGIRRGAYLYRKGKGSGKKPQLMGSGTIMREVIAASDLLKDEFGIESDVWSVLGINELHKDGIAAERYNLTHADKQVPYLTQIMKGHTGPAVIATDYIRAYAEQIRRLIPSDSITILGTDGFGRSDTREALRRFFEVDRNYIALAALRGLGEEKKAEELIKKFNIDIDKSNPLLS